MTQYRIGDLAEASGVNVRNIRAYRERGLLDPPARVGRAAIYSDLHLAQLRAINQLLGRGFTSAHIADFFAAVRAGHDLADVLGLQDVYAATGAGLEQLTALPLDVEPGSAVARKMIAAGLACMVAGQLKLIDPDLVRIVSRGSDRRRYLATIVEVFASTQEGIAAALENVDPMLRHAAEELVATAAADAPVEAVEVLQDYRELAAVVIGRQVNETVRGPAMRFTA